MPLNCAAYGCTNHNRMEKKYRFFRFPNNNEDLRRKWIIACKRKNHDGSDWCPKGKNVYLCGEHFISGQPHKDNPSHPDYVPSIFKFSACDRSSKSSLNKLQRFSSATKRRKARAEVTQSETQTQSEQFTSNDDLNDDLNINQADNDNETVSAENNTNAGDLIMEINNLRRERDTALERIKVIESNFISYEGLKSKPVHKFKYYTGISLITFDNIFKYLAPALPNVCRSKLSFENQFLMTLMRLRLGIQFENLADQFNIPKSTCHDIFKRWLDLLHTKLSFLVHWPDHDASGQTLPHIFRQFFPRLTGIIDCTEFFIDRPKNLKARAEVYSNYKKHSTVKFLIACTPMGSISYISKAWGGRVSDVELVKQSDFISYKYHHRGDQILADRGFTLVDEFAAGCGVELIIPSFTKGKKQLSAKEVETTRQIAAIRVHVERVIGLLKNRYRILDGTISTTLLKSLSDESNECEYTSIDKLVNVCAALCNLGEGIVYVEENYLENC